MQVRAKRGYQIVEPGLASPIACLSYPSQDLQRGQVGALISLLPFRYKFLGKVVFYFGVIFFALNLVSDKLKPLSNAPLLQEWLGLHSTIRISEY